jgi:MFS superfamily sulfate permease-like transporter
LDEDTDLIGLAAANAAAAVTGTFVVDGSPTQTAMVESSGGSSQLAQMATASVVALVLLFLTGPLQYLPRCVLGAIVFVIAIRLVDIRGLRAILRESPGEHALALLTAVVVVIVGVEEGILMAMVLSLLRVVNHSYHPQTSVMVLDERGLFESQPAAAGVFTRPGVVIYRFGAALFYANANFFSKEVRYLAEANLPGLHWMVIDAEAITNIDYSAARIFKDVQQHLVNIGVVLSLARVAQSLGHDLERHRLMDVIGRERIFARFHDALDAFAAEKPSPSPGM